MNFKETKRKGFNFFRSYYDVYNALESDKDKLSFINALLDRQFLGVKPEGLEGMANFAWISQVNSIDSQVKGYEDKTGVKLTPCLGGSDTPRLQVEEKVEEKVEDNNNTTPAKAEEVENPLSKIQSPPQEIKKEKSSAKKESLDWSKLILFINEKTGRSFKVINDTVKAKYKARIKEGYTKEDITAAITNAPNTEFHKENNCQYCTPTYFSRADIIDKYSQITNDSEKIVAPRMNT